MDCSNWQTERLTLKERSKYAFENSLFCDIEFSIVDEEGYSVRIPASKYTLAVTSPVFAAMFYGQLAEKKSIIELPDCTKEGLQQILRFASSDEVVLTRSNVMEVLTLADKFIIPSLVEECRQYLRKLEVGPEDLLTILPQVQIIGDKNLQEYFWGIVEVKTTQFVASSCFLECSRDMLCQLLRRDVLDISELELFKVVDKWATKRIKEKGLLCNGKVKRAILGLEIVRLIRFPLMKHKEFAEVVLPCKILETCEIIELFQIFHSVIPQTNMFINKKRCMGDALIPALRFDRVEDVYITSSIPRLRTLGRHIDAISFTVNKPVYLAGVVLFGKENSEYDVGLTVYKNNHIIYEVFSQHFTDKKIIDNLYFGYTVRINKPVKLEQMDICTVSTRIDGLVSYKGRFGNETVTTSDGLTITFTDSTLSTATNVSDGQFPTFVFRKT